MKVSRFIFNPFGINTLVVWDPDSCEAVIVDPGMSNQHEIDAIDSFVEGNGLKVVGLVNTHLHIDHVMGNAYVKSRYGVESQAHPDDAFLGARCDEQARRFGLRGNFGAVTIDKPLNDGDRIYVGKDFLEVLSVPGHSPGSIALYSPSAGFVISGDALFQGSIGRTDLPGGSQPVLIDAIRRKLFALPDSTVVIPGHGPETTIGNEKKFNPYVG